MLSKICTCCSNSLLSWTHFNTPNLSNTTSTLVHLLKFVKVYDWFRNPCHLSPNYIHIALDILHNTFHQIEGLNLEHDFNDLDACSLHEKLAAREMELRGHIGSHMLRFRFSFRLHYFSFWYVTMHRERNAHRINHSQLVASDWSDLTSISLTLQLQ